MRFLERFRGRILQVPAQAPPPPRVPGLRREPTPGSRYRYCAAPRAHRGDSRQCGFTLLKPAQAGRDPAAVLVLRRAIANHLPDRRICARRAYHIPATPGAGGERIERTPVTP